MTNAVTESNDMNMTNVAHRIGDEAAWRDVHGALVRRATTPGRLPYWYTKTEPVYVSIDKINWHEAAPMDADPSPGDMMVVAAVLDGQETPAELQRLAEAFELREELDVTEVPDAHSEHFWHVAYRGVLMLRVSAASRDAALDAASEHLHGLYDLRAGMTAEEAERVLAGEDVGDRSRDMAEVTIRLHHNPSTGEPELVIHCESDSVEERHHVKGAEKEKTHFALEDLAELADQPADALYVLQCMGYGGQFWNELGGYGSNLAEAKIWARDEAIAQIRQGHERREVAVEVSEYMTAFWSFVERCATKRARTCADATSGAPAFDGSKIVELHSAGGCGFDPCAAARPGAQTIAAIVAVHNGTATPEQKRLAEASALCRAVIGLPPVAVDD